MSLLSKSEKTTELFETSPFAWEVEARLEAKCDALADLFAMDERGQSLKLGINRYYICI